MERRMRWFKWSLFNHRTTVDRSIRYIRPIASPRPTHTLRRSVTSTRCPRIPTRSSLQTPPASTSQLRQPFRPQRQQRTRPSRLLAVPRPSPLPSAARLDQHTLSPRQVLRVSRRDVPSPADQEPTMTGSEGGYTDARASGRASTSSDSDHSSDAPSSSLGPDDERPRHMDGLEGAGSNGPRRVDLVRRLSVRSAGEAASARREPRMWD